MSLAVSYLTNVHSPQTKPCINQVNLESCCVMPKDLTEYAKQNDIQLLTHNDAKGKIILALFVMFVNLPST